MNALREFAKQHWFIIVLAAVIVSGISFKKGSLVTIILGVISLVLAVLILVVAAPALHNIINQYM